MSAYVVMLRSGCPVCDADAMFLFRVSTSVSMPAVSRDTASTYLARPLVSQAAPRGAISLGHGRKRFQGGQPVRRHG